MDLDSNILWYLLIVCIPAILVFIICYMLIKQFLDAQQKIQLLKIQQQNSDKTLNLRLQAYERLTLLFERIEISSLIYRIKTSQMSSGTLQAALMVAIQQEFEHNVSQQIYVSEKLWEFLKLTKQEMFNQLDQVMIEIGYSEDLNTYSDALIMHFAKQKEKELTRRALHGIKQEVKLYL